MAKTTAIALKQYFTEEDYINLCECLDGERKLFSQVFNEYSHLSTHSLFTTRCIDINNKDFENLPNLHINYHLVQHARSYATLLNTGVGTKEMVHQLFKNIIP